MEKATLKRLQKLNQLSLTEKEESDFLSFFDERAEELSVLKKIDTADVERMVHVMPIMTVVREDKAQKLFEREDLQKGAPETMDGYWQVPRLVE